MQLHPEHALNYLQIATGADRNPEVMSTLASLMGRKTRITPDIMQERLVEYSKKIWPEARITWSNASLIVKKMQDIALDKLAQDPCKKIDGHGDVHLEDLTQEQMQQAFPKHYPRMPDRLYQSLIAGINPGKNRGHSSLVAFEVVKAELHKLMQHGLDAANDNTRHSIDTAKIADCFVRHLRENIRFDMDTPQLETLKAFTVYLLVTPGIKFTATHMEGLNPIQKHFLTKLAALTGSMNIGLAEDETLRLSKDELNATLADPELFKSTISDRKMRSYCMQKLAFEMQVYNPAEHGTIEMLDNARKSTLLGIGIDDVPYASSLLRPEKQMAVNNLYKAIRNRLVEQRKVIPEDLLLEKLATGMEAYDASSQRRLLFGEEKALLFKKIKTIATNYRETMNAGVYLRNALVQFDDPRFRDAAIDIFTFALAHLGKTHALYAEAEIKPLRTSPSESLGRY